MSTLRRNFLDEIGVLSRQDPPCLGRRRGLPETEARREGGREGGTDGQTDRETERGAVRGAVRGAGG